MTQFQGMTSSSSDDTLTDMRQLLNKIIEGKITANRRYIDEVLEKIQNANHKFYLEKLVIELQRMELEEKAGNVRGAYQHKVLAETYKDILEKAFGSTV